MLSCMNSATWHSKDLLDKTPKKVDFANWRLLPPAFSLPTWSFPASRRTGNGDDGPTAIGEKGGKMRAYEFKRASERFRFGRFER